MTKSAPDISISTSVFQNWFDATTYLLDNMETSIVTVSSSNTAGDTTTGNMSIEGIITTDYLNVLNEINLDTISSYTSNTVSFTSPATFATASANTISNIHSLGPKNIFSAGAVDWKIGIENSTANTFIIDTGIGAAKFKFSSTGNLTATTFTGNLIGNANTATALASGNTISMTGDVTWVTPSWNGTIALTATSTISNNAVSNAKFRKSAAFGIVGNPTNALADVQDISASSDHTVLRRNGTSLGFGSIDLSQVNSTSNQLPVTRGGTGISSVPSGAIVYGQSATQLSSNSTFMWDSTNNRLGINTALPMAPLHVEGNILSTGDIQTYSDIKLKTNVYTIESALDKIVNLRGVYFDKDGRKNIGVIAQEIEKILPEVVYDGEFKSVAYGNIVAVLIEAIKELKDLIDRK